MKIPTTVARYAIALLVCCNLDSMAASVDLTIVLAQRHKAGERSLAMQTWLRIRVNEGWGWREVAREANRIGGKARRTLTAHELKAVNPEVKLRAGWVRLKIPAPLPARQQDKVEPAIEWEDAFFARAPGIYGGPSESCLVKDRGDTSTITQQIEVLGGELKASTLAVQDMLGALDWIHYAGKEGASAGVLEAYAKHAAQETHATLELQE